MDCHDVSIRLRNKNKKMLFTTPRIFSPCLGLRKKNTKNWKQLETQPFGQQTQLLIMLDSAVSKRFRPFEKTQVGGVKSTRSKLCPKQFQVKSRIDSQELTSISAYNILEPVFLFDPGIYHCKTISQHSCNDRNLDQPPSSRLSTSDGLRRNKLHGLLVWF